MDLYLNAIRIELEENIRTLEEANNGWIQISVNDASHLKLSHK